MASVLTTPLCNLGGVYTKISHVDPLTTQTFLANPTPLFYVLSLVALGIAIVFSAPCHPPAPAPPLPLPPQCKYMQYRGQAGDLQLLGTERHPISLDHAPVF